MILNEKNKNMANLTSKEVKSIVAAMATICLLSGVVAGLLVFLHLSEKCGCQ